ncbi:MAG: hypothetical protein IJP27_00140 [Clostridia bacterium]|nr:hypothetical protein [Clostridia bacterium]
MKRYIAILLVILLMLGLVGCHSVPEEETAAPLSPDTVPEEQEPEEVFPKETKRKLADFINYKVEMRYPDETENVDIFWDRYGLNLERFDRCTVIIGRAFGERTCVLKKSGTGRTYTQLKVEEVLNGELDQEIITISSSYCPRESEDGNTLWMDFQASILPDDQPVLLVLQNKNASGTYHLNYFHTVLPEDYKDYNDAYISELYDYYRRKPGTYKTREDGKTGIETENTPNGTVIHYYGGQEKEQTWSDEELEKLLSDNVLYQFAIRYKIKIWPAMHVRFEGTLTPNGSVNEGYFAEKLYLEKLVS